MARRAIDAKWLVAVLTLMALVAAGCSGADSPEAGDDPDGESTAVDDGSASDGGTRLRSAISEWGSESFDPVLIAASSAWEILTPMYDSLLHIDLEGKSPPASRRAGKSPTTCDRSRSGSVRACSSTTVSPWQFKEHRQGDSILYERADGEHPYRETPAFEELEIILVPEEATRLAMLETGEVDIIALSPENVERVESMDCCRIGEAESTIQAHMFFQGTWDEAASPLNDVRVREALSLAIDREELVEQFMHGFGTPIPGAVPGEFFPGMAGGLDFDHFGGDLYDPERAQQLLDEAGVEPGDLHIPIWTFDMSGAPWLHSLGEVFLGYWEPLGVTGEIRPTDLATFIGMAELDQLDERTSGTFAAFRRRIGFEIGQAVAGLDPRETPGGSMIGPPEGGHIPNVVDRVVETLEAEGDERAELGMALMGEASELYVMPGLFYASALWGVGNRAGEWTPTQRSQTLGQVYETVQPAQ
jgi:peptide/nickel transport system substrate-binding protein